MARPALPCRARAATISFARKGGLLATDDDTGTIEGDVEELAERAARAIHDAFECYTLSFRDITREAGARFRARDWAGAFQDGRRRMDVYREIVDWCVDAGAKALGPHVRDPALWAAMKRAYARCIASRPDLEIAETFFNSVTRRVFTTVGVNRSIEFVESDFAAPAAYRGGTVTLRGATTVDLARAVLHASGLADPCLDADVPSIAKALDERAAGLGARIEAAEMFASPFFRGKAAYLVGRLRLTTGDVPLIVALRNQDCIRADAVLTTEDEASIVFSFTRSYFMVDAERPADLVAFLKTILPRKPIGELYTSIGHFKHGKTELYRRIRTHLLSSEDRFRFSAGTRGLVMVVFDLPGLDLVFKVIRDRPLPPKTVTPERVAERYRWVSRHDRAGRLVEAAEFEHLAFRRERFEPEVLAELLAVAPGSVSVDGDRVDVRHLFLERRLTPLDVFLWSAEPAAARAAVLDFGQAIRDLASVNIFPGDLMLKNFGLTRHGRVVFYDYDELCHVTQCNFRAFPTARNDDDEASGEPWYFVAEGDVFPEELKTFLGLQGELRDLFLQAHPQVFDPGYWEDLKRRHAAGELVDIYPYPQLRRLHGDGKVQGQTSDV